MRWACHNLLWRLFCFWQVTQLIVECRNLSTPIQVQVLQLNNSNFREVTAAFKLHAKYNQTIHMCSRKISGVTCSFGICKSNPPKVMYTNRHPERSTYSTDGKNYVSVFLCNNIPQKKQYLSGRRRIWLALKTMFRIGIVKFPLPDPPSSFQALHWKICSPACHRNRKGGWHPKIIPLTQVFSTNRSM